MKETVIEASSGYGRVSPSIFAPMRKTNVFRTQNWFRPPPGNLDKFAMRLPVVDDLDRHRWNALIEKDQWSETDIATFQRQFDLRTIIRLARRYTDDSGISALLMDAGGLTD